MGDDVATIRRFLEAWPRLDPAELASYFAGDGVHHNMPMAPIAGRAALLDNDWEWANLPA